MSKTLPELPYFSLSGLAKTWECSEDEILHYGIAGKLKICALSAGWELQEGYYIDDSLQGYHIDDGHHIPIKERLSNKEALPLRYAALREILSCGEVTDPEFVLEENDALDQVKDGEKYERFLSSIVISHDMQKRQSNVIVRKGDLIIRKKDAETFLAANNDQAFKEPKIYNLSTMKKEDRETLVLEYAVHVWEEYQKEHKEKEPRIGYVHNQIHQNKNFIRTGKNKRGEPTPSYKTITKEITEEQILKIIQSRKNAEKRA